MRLTTNILILAFTGLIIQACSEADSAANVRTEKGIPVRTMPLQKEIWNQPIHASGRFASEDENLLAFKTGGIIEKIFVREGEAIRSGQLLATLNLTEIDAMTSQAEIGLEKARRDHERTQRLYEDSVATLEQLQNSLTAKRIAEEQMLSANFNKSHSEIRATADGYVLQKMASTGQVVGGGSPILLTTGGNSTGWVLEVGLSDKSWSKVQVGDSALIKSELLPKGQLKSRVVRKSKAAQAMSGSFVIELAVENGLSSNIASGMFAKATIFPQSTTESWTVPYSAIMDANAGKAYVFVTDNDTVAEKVEVQIGAIADENVQVVSGLAGHSKIIIAGSPYLTQGSPISIIQ